MSDQDRVAIEEAWKELCESFETLGDAMAGWSHTPGVRLTDDELRGRRVVAAKALWADAQFLILALKADKGT